MLIDAHAHFNRPGELAARADVRTLFCGMDPESAARALEMRAPGRVLVSCGVHPWRAGQVTVDDMLPFIRRSDALGEIGLDSAWCDVDMAVQRRAFEAQLELAEALSLPVILHTKGMEGEIARTLRRYTVPKLIHWYSCAEHLDEYIEQGCWFTVGPDYGINPAVQAVLRRVPPNRILTETDGLDAVAWGLNRPVEAEEIEGVLRGELRAIAAVHGLGEVEAERLVERNLDRFLDRTTPRAGQ